MLHNGAIRLVTLLTFGACALSGVAMPLESLQISQPNPQGLTAHLSSKPPVFSSVVINGRSFQSFGELSSGMVGKPGAPGLPTQTRWIELPEGMSAKLELQVSSEIVSENVDIAPAPSLSSDNPNVTRDNLFDATAYLVDEITPPNYGFLSDPITIGNTRYVVLTLSPYRYNPVQRKLYRAVGIDANVSFRPDETTQLTRKYDSPAWREVARALSSEPTRDELQPREDHLERIVIVIPDNDDVEEALAPLIEWKERKGYLVTVARLNRDGVGNSAEEIFTWLRDSYRDWAIPQTYVLMVGDAQGQLIMPFWRDGLNRQAGFYVSDNQYVCYEGNRIPESWIPEAFVGRLPVSTIAELNQSIAKILAYEATPYHAEPWVEGSVMIAAGVHSCIETNVAVRELMLNAGYQADNIHETLIEYFAHDQIDHNVISGGVDDGVGFINFRGFNDWGGYSTNEARARRNGTMLPIVTGMVCATCDFVNNQECIGEAWVKAYNGNQPSGAVACWGPTDLYTHTWFNNSLNAEFYHALLDRDVHSLGSLTLAGKLSLLRNYPSSMELGNGTTVGYYLYTYALLGDPSLQVWSHEPRPITVDFEASVPRGQTLLNFAVRDEDNAPVPNAYIHVFLDENTRYGGYSNEDGVVSLSVPPLQNGTYKLTVTGPNLVPVLDEFNVGNSANFAALNEIEFDDDADGDSHGNSDGLVNPNETIELFATYANTGANALANLSGRLTTDNPYVRIQHADAAFGRIAAQQGATSRQAFLVQVLPGTPDGEQVEFVLTATDNNTNYETKFVMPVSSYNFKITEHRYANDELTPGGEGDLIVSLTNYSNLDADSLTAVLYCLDPSIQLRRSQASFRAIAIGSTEDNANQPFQILAGQHAYLGSTINFGLLLTDSNGLKDSLAFGLTIGEAVPEAPQGPDEYGYWAYDSRDATSGMAPEYERVTGTTNLRLDDQNDSESPLGLAGEVTRVDLPFDFQFYGETFDQITIGTNGWLSFTETEVVGWNNLELGSSYMPGGMIAPYWDDLWNGDVYTAYDRNNARFIIEWRDFNCIAGNVRMSVSLYDPTVVPTLTGDGEIVFQYIEVPDNQRDTPNESPTIGICSPDRSIKLQIAHAFDVDPRTSGIHSEMAVRFTTGIQTEIGSLEGHVADLADNSPMDQVRVELAGTGFFTLTDENGYYRIDGITADTYTIIARQLHYNSSRVENVEIRTGATSRADFRLTHPTFSIDTDAIQASVDHDSSFHTSFNISNGGNGPLDYKLSLNYEPDGRDGSWDLLFDYNVTDITGDTRLKGVAFLNGKFYLSGPLLPGEFPHKIYELNREGELLRSFDQFSIDRSGNNGYICLDRKGNNLVAVEQGNIVEITTAGAYVDSLTTRYNPSNCIAWAPERGTYFTKNITGFEFHEMTPDGQVVHAWRSPNPDAFFTYGFAWFPEDPDGFNLYYAYNVSDTTQYGTMMLVGKMNPDNGEFRFVRAIPLQATDRFLDIDITKDYNPLYWTLTMLVNSVGARHLVGVELTPNLSWISYDPDSSSIAPGGSQVVNLGLHSVNMPAGRYDVVLQVIHNAEGDQYDMPITFTIAPEGVNDFASPTPFTFAIESVFPNPFNNVARIGFTLPMAGEATLLIYDLNGRELQRMPLGRVVAGHNNISFNADELPAGLYLAKVVSGGESRITKMTLIK